jgi:MFS transporter, OFA family, oxalate/formate antiporter
MSEESKKTPIFYGWWIVGVTFISNFMSNGMGFYGWNAFLQPLCKEHGWSRTAVNIAPALTVIGRIAQPFFGRMVNRFGVKPIMILCAFVCCGCFAVMGMSASLWMFYLAATVYYISNVGINGLGPNAAVSNWFVRYRGKALGISTSGISLSGALVPPFALFLLTRVSLANAYLIIALMSLFAVVFSASLFMKNKPEDVGMCPDGIAPEPNGGEPGKFLEQKSGPISNSKLLRTPAFWNIGFAYGLMIPGVVGVMSQLKPRFNDMGFSSEKAMLMMAVTALIGSGGKIFWGWLCDRFDSRKVVAASILCQIAGLLVLTSGRSMAVLSAFIVLFGLGMGGVMSTIAVVTAEFFGRENFAKVYGYIALFLLLESSGYIMMGRSFDLFGSYNYAYIGFVIFYSIALVLILTAKRPNLPANTY